jgi:hypothetical protein
LTFYSQFYVTFLIEIFSLQALSLFRRKGGREGGRKGEREEE